MGIFQLYSWEWQLERVSQWEQEGMDIPIFLTKLLHFTSTEFDELV